MNESVEDLSAPAYSYRAAALDGVLEGYATLHRASTASDGRYTMSSGTHKRSDGRMGPVQAARAAELEIRARAALIAAATAAGWHSVTVEGLWGPEVYWYAPADDDQAVADLLTLEAGAAAVPQGAPSASVARHELPLTHSLRLVPRPFSQTARRSYRLGLDVPCGYRGALSTWPYYHQRRRRPVRRDDYPARHLVRSRRIWSARDRDPWEVPDDAIIGDVGDDASFYDLVDNYRRARERFDNWPRPEVA